MDDVPAPVAPPSSSGYNGQDLAFAVFGTIIIWTIVLWLLDRMYRKYWLNKKESQLEDPENAKQEFAFDNAAMENDPKTDSDTNVYKVSSTSGTQLELANNNGSLLANIRGSIHIANGLEIEAAAHGGICVKKVNQHDPSMKIGDIITSIAIDCKEISEKDALGILRSAAQYNVQFGVQPQATFHTERESKLLENYPTLKIDHKLNHELAIEKPTDVVKHIEEQIVGQATTKLSHEQHVIDMPVANTLENTRIPTQIEELHVIQLVETHIAKPNAIKIDEMHVTRSTSLADGVLGTSDEIKLDTSVPPPVNKRTKYLKRELSTDQLFVDQSNAQNASEIATAIGFPLEIPSQMAESAKWAQANRKSIITTTTFDKPEPSVRAKVPISTTITEKPIETNAAQELGDDIGRTVVDSYNNITEKLSEKVNGVKHTIENEQTPISVDQTDAFVKSKNNNNITIESGLVEQVLAVADGFSNETKATLTRQLSELNDELTSSSNDNHVIHFTTSNTIIETNNNHVPNGEKSPTGQYDPWNKQPIDPRSDQITINDTVLTDDIDDTIYPSSWSEQPSSITFESSQDIKTQMYHGLDTSIDNAVFSSDNQGVNSINITSIEIPAKLSLGNVVALNPSQPSSIIIIDNTKHDAHHSTAAADSHFSSSTTKQDDTPQTFVSAIELAKPQSNAFEKLPPHAPARIVNASAKSTTSEPLDSRTYVVTQRPPLERGKSHSEVHASAKSTGELLDSRTYSVTQRPPLERGKSHSEIPVLVRKTSIPTLPSLSTISPALSTSTSSLSRSSPSKIPVFNSKSISPEREFTSSLMAKANGNGTAMSRSHSTLSARSSNAGPTLISVNSIKNSSRNPSGK